LRIASATRLAPLESDGLRIICGCALFRPRLTQRSALSAMLLSISSIPSSQYSVSARHWLSE
jgi:hypothetical protein